MNLKLSKTMTQEQKSSQDLSIVQDKIIKEVKFPDLCHLMYLRPFQCVLNENKGGLATGLNIVNRKSDIQYETKQIRKGILSYDEYKKLSQHQLKQLYQKDNAQQKKSQKQVHEKVFSTLFNSPAEDPYSTYHSYCLQNNADNLLCQMKMGEPMEVAICVCMYNQDKTMLNNTLLGIGENIIKLYNQGVDPDKIVVIIIQDGIQKMNQSILDLIQVFENESGMRFSQKKDRKMGEILQKIDQIDKKKQYYKWKDEDDIIVLNYFLFSPPEQIQKRNQLRLINVKKQYDETKSLLRQIEKLQRRKNITYEDLPPKVLTIFKKQYKKFTVGDSGDDTQDTQQDLNKYFVKATNNLNESRPLVQNSLTIAAQNCKLYLQSRQQISHVSFFRTSQYFPENSGYSTLQLEQKSNNLIMRQQSKQKFDQTATFIENEEQDLSVKMNIFFVCKYKNSQKLSSHNWFFNGFCKQFADFECQKSINTHQRNKLHIGRNSPKYTILLDVGLRPQATALCKMYYTLQNNNQKIGGVCGYMGLKLQRSDSNQSEMRQKLDFLTRISLNFVDIQRAQQLQYHFAHLIDKGFQSIFKFIHVLPGAFSAYNMKAIWGKDANQADKLLQSYFKSIDQKVKNQKYAQVQLSLCNILCRVLLPDFIAKRCIRPVKKQAQQQNQTYEQLMYQSNVYLAEDRILCMGIHKNQFQLIFLPDAYSFVDPVKDLPSLMGQRKRWINGSFFAFQKVSSQFSQMACCQILNIQIWYLAFMNMLAFIAPGFFLFSISVAMEAFKADVLVNFFNGTLTPDSQIYNAFVYTINFIYTMLILGLIYYSMTLTNKNQKFVKFVYAVSTILGIMSLIILTILVVDLVRGLGKNSSYLITNPDTTFIQSIPGGQGTVDAIRYVVLGIMGLYALPLILYSTFFCNFRVIVEVLAGALSFAFYTPTYLIILNIYALCRMDDLSWGTKGLDTGSGSKDQTVLNIWKIIKTIHVAKLVFWNVLVGGLLIHFGSDYLVRFWLTFALMVIIGGTMFLKVFFAILYYIYYKIAINNNKIKKSIKQSPQGHKKAGKYKNKVTPSLYKCLKPQSGQKKSLQSELRDHIRGNISRLHQQSGGSSNDLPNAMTMQLAAHSQIYKGSSQGNVFNKEGLNVFKLVSGIVKKSEQKRQKSQNSIIIKRNRRRVMNDLTHNRINQASQNQQQQNDSKTSHGEGLLTSKPKNPSVYADMTAVKKGVDENVSAENILTEKKLLEKKAHSSQKDKWREKFSNK